MASPPLLPTARVFTLGEAASGLPPITRPVDLRQARVMTLEQAAQGNPRNAIDRFDRARSRLKALARRFDYRAVLKKVEDMINAEGWLQRIMQARFESQSPHGDGRDRWRQLQPATIAARRRRGTWPGLILTDTGAMRAGAVQAVAGKFRIWGDLARGWSIRAVGVDYAQWVNPIRPFMLPPTRRELAPVYARAAELIRAELAKIQ